MYNYWFLLFYYLPIFAASYYINQLAGVLQFILSLILYFFIFYFLHVIWSKIRKKQVNDFDIFMKRFLLSVGTVILLFSSIIGALGYYHLYVSPLQLNQVTISNGEKTVVFQKMIHLGTQGYYQKIQQEITQYKSEDYHYYFEGVRPGTQENTNAFNQALGIKFDDQLYSNLAHMYGLVPQDNHQFLGLINENDFNVDMDINEIMEQYKHISSLQETNDNSHSEIPIDMNSQVITLLSTLEGRELQILQFINLTFLSILTKNEEALDIIQENFSNQSLFEVILEGRNKVLANEILTSTHDKIFATYGALHFEGTLKLLQENDPNWKVISEKTFYPFLP